MDTIYSELLTSIDAGQIASPKEGMWSVVLETLLTTLRLLAPATLFTFFWGHHSLVHRFFHRFNRAIKSASHERSNRVEAALKWLNGISTESLTTLDAVWSKGSLLCEILDSAMPGSCHGHGRDTLSIAHAQTIAEKLLGVSSIFTKEELNSTNQLTPNQEWRFANYLIEIRDAITLLNPPISKPGSARVVHDIQAFTLDYVVRGMGLVTAEIGMKAIFYIYPTAQQGLEPGDISVRIRGPEQCYGSILVPALYGKGHLDINNFGIPKKKYLASLPGSTQLRTHGGKEVENSVPKIRHDILIELSLRQDHARIYYTPNKPGRYDISLISKGCNIVGSPFTVSVPECRPERRNSVELNDDSDLSQNREKNARKIVYRIVDFVTEKMLLTDEGNLEKISEEKVWTILNGRSPMNENNQKSINTGIPMQLGHEPIKKFKSFAHKVQRMIRTINIFKKIPSRLQPYDNKSRAAFKFPDLVYHMTQKCIAERREHLDDHTKINSVTNTGNQLQSKHLNMIKVTAEQQSFNVINIVPELEESKNSEARLRQDDALNKDNLTSKITSAISDNSTFNSSDSNNKIKPEYNNSIVTENELNLEPEMKITKNFEEVINENDLGKIDDSLKIKPTIIISNDNTFLSVNPNDDNHSKAENGHNIEIPNLLENVDTINLVPEGQQLRNIKTVIDIENYLSNGSSKISLSQIISDDGLLDPFNSNTENQPKPEQRNLFETTNALENFELIVEDSKDFEEEIITKNNVCIENNIQKPAIIISDDDIYDSTLYWEESNEITETPEMDRPITPVIKILEEENEKEADHRRKNECFNLFVKKVKESENSAISTRPRDVHFKTDFKIGAPVTNLPSMKSPSPVPDMESVLLASNLEEALRQYDMSIKNVEKINSISSDITDPLPFPLPQISYDDMTDSDIINFYGRTSLEENKTPDSYGNLGDDYGENINASDVKSLRERELRHIENQACNEGQIETWDSAYVSIDEINSSPDSGNKKEINHNDYFLPIQEDNDESFAYIPKTHQRKTKNILEKNISQNTFSVTDLKREHDFNVELEMYATVSDDLFSRSIQSTPTFKSIEEEDYLKLDLNNSRGPSHISYKYSDEYNNKSTNTSTPCQQTGYQKQNLYKSYIVKKKKKLNAKNIRIKSSLINSASVEQNDVKTNLDNISQRCHPSVTRVRTEPLHDSNAHQNKHLFGMQSLMRCNDFGNTVDTSREEFIEDIETIKNLNDIQVVDIDPISENNAIFNLTFEKGRLSTNSSKQNDSLYNQNANQENGKIGIVVKDHSQVRRESQENTRGYNDNYVRETGSLVLKWKKYWDDKLKTLNENDGINTFQTSYERKHLKYRSQPNINNAFECFEENAEKYDCTKSIDNLSMKCGTHFDNVNGKSSDNNTDEEELKVFESSPKRYFVRAGSREKITHRINTFNAAPENISLPPASMVGNKQKSGFVTRNVNRFDRQTSSPDCKINTNADYQIQNIKNYNLVTHITKDDKQTDDDQIGLEINYNNEVSSPDLNKLFYKPTEKKPITKEDTSDLKEKKDFLNRHLTERLKQTKESVKTVSQNTVIQKNEDLMSNVETDTRSISVLEVISSFENHSQATIKSKTIGRPEQWKCNEGFDEKKTQNHNEVAASPLKISATSSVSMKNNSRSTAIDAQSSSKCVRSYSTPSITHDLAEAEKEVFKERFRQTKNFFESLEKDHSDKSKKDNKLNECQMIFLGIANVDSTCGKIRESLKESGEPTVLSPILDKLNTSNPIYDKQPRRRRKVKAFSAPTSDTEYDQGIRESRLFKISERFHIENFFRDIAGDGALKRSGSLRGIPRKNAVLAAFESLNESPPNPYDHTTSQLSDFERSNGVVNSQTYSSEYPFLPTTEPGKYRSRYDAAASGMVSRADMLRLRRKTRRYSVPDEWKRLCFTEI